MYAGNDKSDHSLAHDRDEFVTQKMAFKGLEK
jgi:hypothetical protein